MIPFAQRLQPAIAGPVFERDEYYTWCPSVVEDDNVRYHMFASTWPKTFPFMLSYPINSHVIRAESDNPAGPFEFKEIVLGDRGEAFWDGRATHNPQVHRIGDCYVLFYIGTTFPGRRPGTLEQVRTMKDIAYDKFRIGYAVADRPEGPWQRLDAPALDVRPEKWDSSITTNPAVCVCADGSLLMIYRSNTMQGCRLGIARAAALGEPFERLCDEPILTDLHLEDPFLWQDPQTGRFQMIAKDLSGKATGEFHAGVHASSEDGIHWSLAAEPQAYSRTLTYADGRRREVGHLERPYILFRNGEPAMLYFATAIPEGPFIKIDDVNRHTWITGVPLG